ncbi:hypothetical protein L1887_11867 [Cichorium endivia]|nr:hypothetical protein L1887_11867 [Cichorium endivia]
MTELHPSPAFPGLQPPHSRFFIAFSFSTGRNVQADFNKTDELVTQLSSEPNSSARESCTALIESGIYTCDGGILIRNEARTNPANLTIKLGFEFQKMKIWDDCKSLPIAVLRPHDGLPVNSVTFLTDPQRPYHIILIIGVYCVQTQFIQQYALDMSQCVPPPNDNVPYERSDSIVIPPSI